MGKALIVLRFPIFLTQMDKKHQKIKKTKKEKIFNNNNELFSQTKRVEKLKRKKKRKKKSVFHESFISSSVLRRAFSL